MTLKLAVLVLALALHGTAAYGQQTARLMFSSQPGDWVGQGQNWHLYYPPAGEIFTNVRRLLNEEPAYVEFVLAPTGGSAFSLLSFSTDQLGVKMQVGVYTDAERAAFASPGHPGLDVGFQHRGCGDVSGSFTVTDATFTGETIESFVARFEQHCNGLPPALFGVFAYQQETEFEPLVPGSTPIRRIHLVQLRSRIAALQARLGLGPTAYADAAITAGVTPIRVEHVSELRTTLTQVYQAAGHQPPSFSDADLTGGMVVRVAHINELRAAVIAIEALVFQ